ncbi:MAG: glycosyltransferase [Pseudomonas sp.]|jgi:rhamnosyltransferase|uniref:Glycosyl transferase, family 2 n=1 Tax=Pseudomonas putida (strain ATCC 700007 / DSM 6899 / JCM 31910 / BCRC 17059 / LMG 24140 / F1) TaxID=351746 RepID=A5W7E6_PSEP1|nr:MULTISPECIES: glycosyltransferase [Pseudomonas]MDD1998858.1 glycosyltransferase [Pseudomonas putida]MEB3437650.1 glycosyltransferase [Pseudomonas sp. A2]MPT20876.1 glycosyltransferase [Pseudomonas sp.]POA86665.1 glycosyl transferase [Pseudomonas sp. FW305-E2]HDS1791525.1 glycosyltransferase [Pseudomonas putida]
MADNLPQVAVLLAAYNGMSWIEEQLASILSQTNVHVSIFISVDPSSDGTEGWCADYAAGHESVFVLPPAGPFGGAAPNFFRLIRDVDFSTFDYLSFSDQDDIWYPDKLERAVAQLRTGNFDGYSSNVVAFWPDGRRLLVDKAQPQVAWDYLFEAAGPGCTYVLTQKLAAALKRLIAQRWEAVQNVALHDWFCYAYARSAGYRWFIDPVPRMDYRQHLKNQVGVNAGLRSAISRVRQVVQGWWFSQVKLIRELTLDTHCQDAVPKSLKCSGRILFLRLMIRAQECRRRRRDQFAFVVLCMLSALFRH